jgi:hypothetical protein
MSGIKAAVRLYRDAIAPELEQAAKDACKGVGKRGRLTPAQRRWIDDQAAARWDRLPQWEQDEYKKAAGVYVDEAKGLPTAPCRYVPGTCQEWSSWRQGEGGQGL